MSECPRHKLRGGCDLPNVQCRWPACNVAAPVEPPAQDADMVAILRSRDLELPEFHAMQLRIADRLAALTAEIARVTGECGKAERLWKEASIDASRKHDTIGGLENACRISIARAESAERKLAQAMRVVAKADAMGDAYYFDPYHHDAPPTVAAYNTERAALADMDKGQG